MSPMIVRRKRSAKLTLSDDQIQAVAEITRRFQAGQNEVTLGGLAGTGKTTIASRIADELELRPERVAYCAPTGKAARVLTQKLKGRTASTIHGLIYRPQEVHCTKCPRSSVVLYDEERERHEGRCHNRSCPNCYVMYGMVPTLEGLRLVLVDEASMVNEEVYEDLRSYDVPTLWIGDHGQLPPVKSKFSLMDDPDIRLERIHRQAADSPILQLAMQARRTGVVAYGEHGPGVVKRRHDGTFDVGAWSRDLLVMCGLNRTRVCVNQAARKQRGFHSDRPEPGDRLICLRNNKQAGIFNGMLGTLVKIRPDDGHYAVEVDLDDSDATYSGTIAPEQFNYPKTMTEIPRSEADLWDYGYCLTVHKAQGSEADRVILIEEPFGSADDQRRWLYTGITRAKRELEIIGRPPRRR